MRFVVGTFPQPTYEHGQRLPKGKRVVFDGHGTQIGGYFDLIAPSFDSFAEVQCSSVVYSLHVLVVLGEAELATAISIVRRLHEKYLSCEERWLYHQGSVRSPGQPEQQVFIALQRRRLLGVLQWLEGAFEEALSNRHCVVFGSGVCMRMLSGMSLYGGRAVTPNQSLEPTRVGKPPLAAQLQR